MNAVKIFATIFFAFGLGAAMAAPASSTNTTPAKPAPAKVTMAAPPRAVFIQPASTRDGRDPFYPESARPFEAAAASAPHAVEMTALTVKGFSIVRGRPMVIINNHSFMVGDEGDVLGAGGRAHLRCVEIRSDTVIVEINGSRHEIHY
jgi:hypothetical protein